MGHAPITVKPIDEVSKFYKNQISANIPPTYALNPTLSTIANDENIRAGVIVFRDFLLAFFDRLFTDGHLYAKPPKKPGNMADYPFINYVNNLLVEIGYQGKLDSSGELLLVTGISVKIPFSSLRDCFKFLSLCGFVFNGIDFEAKKLEISETRPLEVSYPSNPILLTGLKTMSFADMELRAGRRYSNDNNLLRCDYRLIMAEKSDIGDILFDLLQPLPAEIQNFAMNLHRRYTDMGLTCMTTRLGNISFAYVYPGKGKKPLSVRDMYAKRVWEFSYSVRNGYCLFVRAKKTDKYTDIIKTFPATLQDKISQGYGCYRKFGRERCQMDCQGIGIPLDESILDMSKHIEIWLDNEIPNALLKEGQSK